jgi:hypothetical protein
MTLGNSNKNIRGKISQYSKLIIVTLLISIFISLSEQAPSKTKIQKKKLLEIDSPTLKAGMVTTFT